MTHAELFEQGKQDCEKGLKPQSIEPWYTSGYKSAQPVPEIFPGTRAALNNLGVVK
jgi:hypothetical protein